MKKLLLILVVLAVAYAVRTQFLSSETAVTVSPTPSTSPMPETDITNDITSQAPSSINEPYYDPIDNTMSADEYLKKSKELDDVFNVQKKNTSGQQVFVQALESGQVYKVVLPLDLFSAQSEYNNQGTTGVHYTNKDFELRIRHAINTPNAEADCERFVDEETMRTIMSLSNVEISGFKKISGLNGNAAQFMENSALEGKTQSFMYCQTDGLHKVWILDMYIPQDIYLKKYANGQAVEILKSFQFTK